MLVFEPNEILHKKTNQIDVVDKEIEKLINNMRATMVAARGIGIAANQVGKNLRLFLIDEHLSKENKIPSVFINAKIVKSGGSISRKLEGCLSLPEKFEVVNRPSKVMVEALNAKGKRFSVNASGLLARVLQHEIDHLEGILFVDRI